MHYDVLMNHVACLCSDASSTWRKLQVLSAQARDFGPGISSFVPFNLCIYVWNIFMWLFGDMIYEKYDKSLEDDVCSFCPYCTVFTFDSLDTLTPHCCLNVNGCVLFFGCGKHIDIFTYNVSFLFQWIRQCCYLVCIWILIQFSTAPTIFISLFTLVVHTYLCG